MTDPVKLPFDVKVRGEGRIITPEEKARASSSEDADSEKSASDEPDNE